MYPIQRDQRSTGFLMPTSGIVDARVQHGGAFSGHGPQLDQTFYADSYSLYGRGFATSCATC